jgi:phospholipid transport system substrate-binding protein
MDFRKNEPGRATGLPRGAAETLADPIVMALMAADRVDPKAVEALLQRVAASLSRPDPQPGSARFNRDEKPAADIGFGMLAKSFALALAVIAGLFGAPRSAAADEAPVAFIRSLGTQAVSVIRSAMPLGAKADYFNQMLRADFDLTGICRFVLGPYWRVASSAEQQQFCDGFADRLVHFYGSQLAQAGDGNFLVTGSESEPDGVIVTSRIVHPQGAAIAVDWRLGVTGGLYKIEDVAVDGVSMALAQRSEISALIAREGGQIEMLLATMRG